MSVAQVSSLVQNRRTCLACLSKRGRLLYGARTLALRSISVLACAEPPQVLVAQAFSPMRNRRTCLACLSKRGRLLYGRGRLLYVA